MQNPFPLIFLEGGFRIPMSLIQYFLIQLLQLLYKNEKLANELFDASQKNDLDFFRIPLKASAHTKGFSSDNRWKVIVNAEIEIDE